MNARRILHVDSDRAFLAETAPRIRALGYEVESLDDTSACLTAVETSGHHVVLLAADLSQTGGIDLLQSIKAYDETIQIVLLTDRQPMTAVLKAFRRGADYCFFKPLVDEQPLAEALTSIFAKIDHQWAAAFLASKGAADRPASLQPAKRRETGGLWLTSEPADDLHINEPPATEPELPRGSDRRREPRSELQTPAWVVPIHGGMVDPSAAVAIETKDISSRGIGLVTNAPLPSEEVFICLSSVDAQTVMHGLVRATTKQGEGRYQIGVQIVGVLPRQDVPELAGIEDRLASPPAELAGV